MIVQCTRKNLFASGLLLLSIWSLVSAAPPLVSMTSESSVAPFISLKSEKRLPPPPPLKIIIMGGPASGKGTQCEQIVAKHNVVHVSTGDLLRNNNSSEVVKRCMDRGVLVPDEVIIGLVLERLAQPDCVARGWLLDGFPRTAAQAKALAAAGVQPNLFLYLRVSDATLMERVVQRRMDPVTGRIYHLAFMPPPNHAIASRLVQRSDDTRESMATRLRQFHANADAVKGFYRDILVELDGSDRPDRVTTNILHTIQTTTTTTRVPI